MPSEGPPAVTASGSASAPVPVSGPGFGTSTPASGPIDRAFASLGLFSVRWRWLIVAVWIALAVVVPQVLPSLASQTRGQNADFLPKGTPSLHAAQLASPFQSKNALSTLLVAGRAGAALSPADDVVLTHAEAALAHDPDVLDVRDQGVSADGQARRALIELKPSVSFTNADKVLARLRRAVAATGTGAGGGLEVHLAGELAQSVDKRTQDSRNRSLVQQLSVLFILALLLVVFRALLAPILTLIPAGLSLVVAGPLIGEAASAGVEVSSLTQILLTVIVLGAGTDYGLFLIYRVREEMARGAEPRVAVTLALSRVGETITFSALCVIFALISVVLADFGLYRGLGPGLAIGVAVILLAGLTLLPALLAIAGRAAFWPARPRPGREYRGAWGTVAGRVVRRPRATLGVGLVVFVALALGLLGYTAAGFGSQTAPPGTDSARGERVLGAHFPVAVRNPTNVVFSLARPVWQDPAPLVEIDHGLRGAPQLRAVLGALDPNGVSLSAAQLVALHSRLGPAQRLALTGGAGATSRATYAAYRSTTQFISADGRTVQFYASLSAGEPSSTAALHAIPAVRRTADTVARHAGVLDHGVAGEAAAGYDVSRVSTHDLQRIIPIVLLIIGVLLALLLRSLVAPLYLLVSVALSYLASLGLAVLVFVEIAGNAGLNFVLPFFMFIFLMALGSDYNILVMTRIREEAQAHPLSDAVRRAVAATGGTVTSAGLVLAGTFGLLTVTGDSQTQEIGLGLAAGILLDTFLVRTLLIPATVILVGRWSWWPSSMASTPLTPPSPTALPQARSADELAAGGSR